MNSLLLINKRYVLIALMSFVLIFFIFFTYKFMISSENKLTKQNLEISNVDIKEPKFAISNSSKKIFVTAREGNYLSENNVILRNDVKFTSENFTIETDNVTFNRKNQTAHSKDKSIFKSKKTVILSEGFDIFDNGNKINFYGNSRVILKWK